MTTNDAIQWAGKSQTDLAKKLGIKQPSISAWGDYPTAQWQLRIQLLSKGKLKAEPWALTGGDRPKQAA